MINVSIRFYEELNYFVTQEKRKIASQYSCQEGTTVKALIEDLGVPHTEVDLVLVNSQSVDFGYKLANGDMVSVYPVFESFDISPVSRVRPQALRNTRFILDVHLGRLAVKLRMLGFDTSYSNAYTDETLARLSREQKRIILTRDRELLKRKIITHGYYVKLKKPTKQMIEVLNRFDLWQSIYPFSRCLECNTKLKVVEKKEILDKVPKKVYRLYTEFKVCPDCQRIYWKGSHWQHMKQKIEALKDIKG